MRVMNVGRSLARAGRRNTAPLADWPSPYQISWRFTCRCPAIRRWRHGGGRTLGPETAFHASVSTVLEPARIEEDGIEFLGGTSQGPSEGGQTEGGKLVEGIHSRAITCGTIPSGFTLRAKVNLPPNTPSMSHRCVAWKQYTLPFPFCRSS